MPHEGPSLANKDDLYRKPGTIADEMSVTPSRGVNGINQYQYPGYPVLGSAVWPSEATSIATSPAFWPYPVVGNDMFQSYPQGLQYPSTLGLVPFPALGANPFLEFPYLGDGTAFYDGAQLGLLPQPDVRGSNMPDAPTESLQSIMEKFPDLVQLAASLAPGGAIAKNAQSREENTTAGNMNNAGPQVQRLVMPKFHQGVVIEGLDELRASQACT
ncbi:hypothetical protein AURDEDRAFT_172945 [Auricularia subglabra TFB-10046 SS5]|uniref:Uncharacterized protein n=1 Tax=Auricularia subglabra (strain TFB-10046 / SS5) TaxID=717982 RepID=J0LI83_AURST|nr:hypothetical protein AURDEDRAFT_172945 [Auricularia subglabra TFB-10046 SS5]